MTTKFTPLVFTDPMQAFLAGALLGLTDRHCRQFMKIIDIVPGNTAPNGFEVLFASGLHVAVRVEVLEPAKVQT